MSKNYMTTVAAVLGVEIGDTFKVIINCTLGIANMKNFSKLYTK